jgi:hypothetical protein
MSLFGSRALPETFPEVRASSLDGEERTLPRDLPAPLSLVVVLFRDRLDPLADQWARLGHSLQERFPGQVAAVETPVVGRGMKLLGDLATTGIRGQVDDETERARTMPIYVDKKPFRSALKLNSTSEVYPFLVERATGAILWRGAGDITMAQVQDLEAAIEEAATRLDASGATPEADHEDEASETAYFDGPGELDAPSSGPTSPTA